MQTRNFKIIAAQSNIDWTGRKITGSHNGTIAIKEGSLVLNDGKLTGGQFIVDVKSIKILDITDPNTNAQFAGHLASDDFFSIEQHPEAILVIDSATDMGNSSYSVLGDLTIKGITNAIAFEAVIDIDGDTLTASAKIAVDRTKYDMKFRSGNFFQNLGDNLIYNDFNLDVSLVAKEVPDEKDKNSIEDVLENYFKGIYEGDLDLLNTVYNKGTLLYGDVKGEPYSKTLTEYLDGVKNRQSPKDSGKPFKGEIESIKLVNSIAVAEVNVKMYDHNYHEFLSFHKLNGKWVLVNKMISDLNA